MAKVMRAINLPSLLMVWLTAFLFLKYVIQFVPGIFSAELLATLHHSASEFGFLGAAYFYAYLLLQVPAGILVDKYPVSRIATCSLIICLLGLILFFTAHTFLLLVIARVMMGTGAAFASVSYMRAAAIHFDAASFARLSGFFGSACMGGAGTTLLLFGWFHQALGAETTSTIVIGLVVAVVLIGFYFVKAEPQIPRVADDAPKEESSEPLHKRLLQIITDRNNILLTIYNGAAFAPLVIFGNLWGTHYLMNIQGLTEGQAGVTLSFLFYGFVTGGIVLGRFAKTSVVQRQMMLGGTLFAMTVFAFIVYMPAGIFNQWALVGLLFIMGFGLSALLMSYALAKTLNPPAMVATVIAIVNMGDPIFGSLTDPLIGFIIDHYKIGNHFTQTAYHMSFLVFMVYWAIACACAGMIRLSDDPDVSSDELEAQAV